MRRTTLLLILISIPAFSALAADAKQPNILFLFADDQTFASIGALNNPEIRTPNLDRLVRRGTTFTHAYNQGGWHGAICVASRTMLNTGRFLWNCQPEQLPTGPELAAGRFWAPLLKQAGYRTYMTGKWHVQAKPEAAFDVVRHVRPGMPKDTPDAYNRPLAGQPDSWSPFDESKGGFWQGGKHWSQVTADDAIDFLSDAAQHDQPFFLYVAFNAPHDPRQSPQRFVEMYPPEKIRLPESFLPEYPFKDAIGCGPGLRDEKLAPFPRTEHAVRVHRAEYYAIITHLDEQIGRVLDALEQGGRAGNTIIIFTADHGLSVGHHGLIGKQNMYEHSMRVPLVLAGPGVHADRRLEMPVYLQDVMPTTLELAGAEVPQHVQFRSLLPLMRGERTEQYPAIYGAYMDLQRMVRKGRHKLILYPKANTMRLYDLQEDPDELHDRAGEESMQPIIQNLLEDLRTLQKQTGDEMPIRAAPVRKR